ncbi:MAG: FtsQ-type POTRA domain-containing protein [Candidatus Aminicenantes bacterium]|nr:FtsQ-type POTRA domain-containing protein [Candidatus Aminicenantes bacterium]
MAVNLNLPFKYRLAPAVETSLYRRGEKRAAPKKIQKKFKVKPLHIFLLGILITGIFVTAQQTYLYLIGWDKLTISEIDVVCGKLELKAAAESYLAQKHLGNILLLDIDHLRHSLESHPWIKEVHIGKALPSRIKIVITERIPTAVIQSGSWVLIDREGVELSPITSPSEWKLPLFTDKQNFQKEREEKLMLAWKLLEELPPEERERVQVVNLSQYDNVQVKLKDFPAWIKLGHDRFFEKLQTLDSERLFLERFDALEYVDLRLPERIYFKAQTSAGTAISAAGKE